MLHFSTAATILVRDLSWVLLNFVPAGVGDCCQELLTHLAVTRLVNTGFWKPKQPTYRIEERQTQQGHQSVRP
jgi:hypothetical protein